MSLRDDFKITLKICAWALAMLIASFAVAFGIDYIVGS